MQIVKFLVCCLFFLLVGCESSVGVGVTSLSEPAMSAEVDSVTMAPINPTDTFLATVNTLQATVKLSNALANTTVTARFYYGEEGQKEIAHDAVTASGSGYLNFSLNPPESGWPLGVYRVEFYLGKEIKESLSFYIKKQLPVAEKSSLALPSKKNPGYKQFNDKQFGFSLELPDSWNFKEIGKNSDYLFQGPQGTDEGEIAVIIQMIDTRQPPQSTLDDEMLNQSTMLSAREGAKIVKKSVLQVAGKQAPFFLATYSAHNQREEMGTWGHTQLGLQNGPIILLISYAAPREIYQNKVDLFQHMIDSFHLNVPKP